MPSDIPSAPEKPNLMRGKGKSRKGSGSKPPSQSKAAGKRIVRNVPDAAISLVVQNIRRVEEAVSAAQSDNSISSLTPAMWHPWAIHPLQANHFFQRMTAWRDTCRARTTSV
jgi:hypothetical protein